MSALLVGIAMGFVAAVLVAFGFAFYALGTGSKTYGGLRVLTFRQLAGGAPRIGLQLDVRKAGEIEDGPPSSFAKANWYFTPREAFEFAQEIASRAVLTGYIGPDGLPPMGKR